MADEKVKAACGTTSFDTFDEAMTCKAKVEVAERTPYRADWKNSGGNEFTTPDTWYEVVPFPSCVANASFEGATVQAGRLDAKICAESLTRITGQNYTFQVVPDSWAGWFDAYKVVPAADYTGATAGSRFDTKEAAQDAADALKAKTGKEYTVVNAGSGYIVEEKK